MSIIKDLYLLMKSKGAVPSDRFDSALNTYVKYLPFELINLILFSLFVYKVAFESQPGLEDGTYELCGVHIKSNPEHIAEGDVLIKHGSVVLDVPRTFEGIRQFLEEHDIEGIVFHRENGDMCKIKRTDFHFMWNGSYSSR